MFKAYKFRIYPDDEQKRLIAMNIGCNRWVWNYTLEKLEEWWKENKDKPREERTKRPSAKVEISRELTILKKNEETSWLNEADSMSFTNTLKDVDESYDAFFKGIRKKPKKKKKTHDGSYSTRKKNVKVDWENQTIRIPKMAPIKAILHRRWGKNDKMSDRITISKESFDRYYISFSFDDGIPEPKRQTPTIDGTFGLDLGMRNNTNAVLSDGTRFDIFHVDKRLEKKLKREERKLAKKQWIKDDDGTKKPSKNYIKQREKVAKIKCHIREQREHHVNEISAKLANDTAISSLCVESLNVAGMLSKDDATVTKKRNTDRHRKAANACMGELTRQLEYKCARTGTNFVKINRFFASSQICSVCGYKNEGVKDVDNNHEWDCPNCGAHHDRDYNAAVNIKNEGYRILTKKND